MKISFDVTFVMDFPPTPEMDAMGLSGLVMKQMLLASSADGFQKMFDDMLVQTPHMIKAEVMDVKEYFDEAYDQDREEAHGQ